MQLVVLVVLARLLDPRDFGLVAMTAAVVGIASVVGDFGLSLAALQAPTLSHAQRSNLFWVNAAVGVATGSLVAACAGALAAFYQRPEIVGLTLALASVFVISGLTVQFKVQINRDARFVALGFTDFAGQLCGLAAAITGAAMGAGYWALVDQQIVGSVVTLVLAVALARWRPGLPQRHNSIRSLIRYGRDTFAVQITNYLTTNLDSVLIGRQFGPAVLGLYNRAFQVVVLPLDQVLAPLTRIFLPQLARVDPAQLPDAAARIQRALAYVIVGPLSLLAATASVLLPIVLGDRWIDAAALVPVLVVGAVFQALGYVYYWCFLARARTRYLFYSELWGRAPMVVLMVLLVHLGSLWIAGVVALGQALIWLAATVYYGPRIGLDTWRLARQAARPCLLFLIAYAVTAGAGLAISGAPQPLRLFLLCLVWVTAVAALALPLRPYRRDIRAVATQFRRSAA